MAARAGLLVLNAGSATTFRRPGYAETIPDVSFASERLAPLVGSWRVVEDYTGSDHQYICFELRDRQPRRAESTDRPPRWSTGRIDEDGFARAISGVVVAPTEAEPYGRAHVENIVESTMRTIAEACEVSIPRGRPRHGKRPVYWWTPEIAELRRECLRLRREAQRARGREDANRRSVAHKLKKKQLRHAIGESKARCWRKLREDVEADPWGLGYKIVTQKLGARRSPDLMDTDVMDRIVRALFPTHPERDRRPTDRVDGVVLFSMGELERAVRSLKPGKAPGPDGMPGEVLKAVFRTRPDLLLGMYNACLSAGVFPQRWKRARLVLIGKGKGDPGQPSAYRPLCMLDTAGKVLEKLLRPRLLSAIDAAGGLSPRQYGFRAGRSTVDAIAEVADAVRRAEDHNHFSRRIVLLVTLDVRNAFNSARWADILRALEEDFRVPGYLMQMMQDYLADRTLQYETTEGHRSMEVTAGAAQGSVLGPDLWNAAYDSLLRINMPEETVLVGYADDVAVLVAARDVELAQIKLNQAMRGISAWMRERGLSLALNKTEIVVLTKKRINTIFPVRVGEEEVVTRPAAKYLGVTIDSGLSFFEQIKETADKAAKGVTALSRLMANVGGPRAGKRRLLMSSVQSVLLYGAEIWAQALTKEMYRVRLGRVQRRAALRVASAYRTVSEPAVLVIAGVIPIALLAWERQAVYLRRAEGDPRGTRTEERSRTLAKWQESWERETRGRWTRRLIGEVATWLEREYGEVDYYLTQFLSGHGYFRAYLNRMGKASSAECMYCPGACDDAEHTFFACERWAPARTELEMALGREFSPDTAVEQMVEDGGAWDRVSHYVQGVLRAKKGDLDTADR